MTSLVFFAAKTVVETGSKVVLRELGKAVARGVVTATAMKATQEIIETVSKKKTIR